MTGDSVTITLNGEPFELVGPLTVSALLTTLDIDARRVAVEHNLVVVKRLAFETTEYQHLMRFRWKYIYQDFRNPSLVIFPC